MLGDVIEDVVEKYHFTGVWGDDRKVLCLVKPD
jgi:hypothetical protein